MDGFTYELASSAPDADPKVAITYPSGARKDYPLQLLLDQKEGIKIRQQQGEQGLENDAALIAQHVERATPIIRAEEIRRLSVEIADREARIAEKQAEIRDLSSES